MIYFQILGALGIEGNCFVPAKGTHQLASMATKTVFILSFYDLFSNFGWNWGDFISLKLLHLS